MIATGPYRVFDHLHTAKSHNTRSAHLIPSLKLDCAECLITYTLSSHPVTGQSSPTVIMSRLYQVFDHLQPIAPASTRLAKLGHIECLTTYTLKSHQEPSQPYRFIIETLSYQFFGILLSKPLSSNQLALCAYRRNSSWPRLELLTGSNGV